MCAVSGLLQITLTSIERPRFTEGASRFQSQGGLDLQKVLSRFQPQGGLDLQQVVGRKLIKTALEQRSKLFQGTLISFLNWLDTLI